jgi:putative SOS response-associated peptidase YedK
MGMCGRFTLTTPGELVAEVFGLDEVPKLAARYNVAPGQPVAVVRGADPPRPRQLSFATWGLARPAAADDSPASGLLINARSESAAARPTFREAFRSRRCLLPANGFYEWRRGGGRREAFHFRRRDGGLLAFAGLLESGAPGDAGACVILTTEANDLVREVHDRMPVIVRPEDFARWLDPAFHDAAGLRHVLAPFPAWLMQSTRVGPAVNSATHDGPECLEPPRQGSLFEL